VETLISVVDTYFLDGSFGGLYLRNYFQMGKFLFYSDYLRFWEDLNSCRELVVIADLVKDFTKCHIQDNSSLYTISLDAIWNIYPEYDMECNVGILFDYNIELYAEYKNPKLEFAAQYLYYLSDQHYEVELRTSSNPASIDEQDQFTTAKLPMALKEPKQDYNLKKPSFGISPKFKSNLIQIIDSVNAEVEICREQKFSEKFANLLTQNDLSALDREDREFAIICNTNFFVAIFGNLEKTFSKKFDRYLFDEYSSFMMVKSQKKLSSGTFNTSNSRNGDTPPILHEVIDEMCLKYSPSSYRI
jgi:hypothetical protein